MLRKLSAISLFFLVWSIQSCSQPPTRMPNARVESLRDNYLVLLNESQNWRKDAYLESVSFDLEDDGGTINAHFQSPSDDDESLRVVYDPTTSEITTEVFVQNAPILMHVPIKEADWKLDSVDVMRTFLSFDDVAKLWIERPNQRCNALELRHFYVADQWVLAWVLTIADCNINSLGRVGYFYLDPLSGKRLDLKY